MSLILSVAHLLHIDGRCDERLLNELMPGVSSRIAEIYRDVLSDEVPDEVVICAMLGATVALSDAFDMADSLPATLRSVATGLEQRLLLRVSTH